MTTEIRHATRQDIAALTELYNYYVKNTPITFDLVPKTVTERLTWFEQFKQEGRYQLLVAVDERRVIGYACSHRFREKAAYQTSVEVTIYLHPEATGKKIGSRLYAALFEQLAGCDVHRVFAGITLPNDASVALHQKMGFEQSGLFTEVGYKFEQFWDVGWYERKLLGLTS